MYQDKKLQIINVFNSEMQFDENKNQLNDNEIALVEDNYQLISKQTADEVINEFSPENIYIETSGNITLTFESADPTHVSTKRLFLKSLDETILNISGAEFMNKIIPEWGGVESVLLLEVLFIGGLVLLKTLHNSEANIIRVVDIQ